MTILSLSYDTVATFSQITSLLMFIAMFIGVIVYATWPGNGARFELAQQRALDLAGKTDKEGMPK